MPDTELDELIEETPIHFNKGDIVIYTNPITNIETEYVVDYANLSIKSRKYKSDADINYTLNDEYYDNENPGNFIRISQLLESGTINSILITDLTNFRLKEEIEG